MQKFHLISGSVWDSTDAKEVLRNVQSNCLGEAKLLMRFLPTMTTSSSNPAQACSPTLPQQERLLSATSQRPDSIRGNDYSNEFHNSAGVGDKNGTGSAKRHRRQATATAEDDDSPLPNSSHEEVRVLVSLIPEI